MQYAKKKIQGIVIVVSKILVASRVTDTVTIIRSWYVPTLMTALK